MGPDALGSSKWPVFYRVHPFLLLRIPALSNITPCFYSNMFLYWHLSPKPKIPTAKIETIFSILFASTLSVSPSMTPVREQTNFVKEILNVFKGRGRNFILCSLFQCPSNVCFGLYFMLVFLADIILIIILL